MSHCLFPPHLFSFLVCSFLLLFFFILSYFLDISYTVSFSSYLSLSQLPDCHIVSFPTFVFFPRLLIFISFLFTFVIFFAYLPHCHRLLIFLTFSPLCFTVSFSTYSSLGLLPVCHIVSSHPHFISFRFPFSLIYFPFVTLCLIPSTRFVFLSPFAFFLFFSFLSYFSHICFAVSFSPYSSLGLLPVSHIVSFHPPDLSFYLRLLIFISSLCLFVIFFAYLFICSYLLHFLFVLFFTYLLHCLIFPIFVSWSTSRLSHCLIPPTRFVFLSPFAFFFSFSFCPIFHIFTSLSHFPHIRLLVYFLFVTLSHSPHPICLSICVCFFLFFFFLSYFSHICFTVSFSPYSSLGLLPVCHIVSFSPTDLSFYHRLRFSFLFVLLLIYLLHCFIFPIFVSWSTSRLSHCLTRFVFLSPFAFFSSFSFCPIFHIFASLSNFPHIRLLVYFPFVTLSHSPPADLSFYLRLLFFSFYETVKQISEK